MQTDYDIVIIGGGLVGASLACALGDTPLRVAVVEALPLAAEQQPSYDERTLAMAYGSRRIFEGMGLWQQVEANGAYPIRRIHISDRGHFGITRLRAEDAGLEALGYVVANRAIGQALYDKLPHFANVSVLCPAILQELSFEAQYADCRIQVDDAIHTLKAGLVVVADGGRSEAIASLGIPARRLDYEQTAIVSTVTPGRPHQATAFERFTDTGPLALLPMDDTRCAVVWSVAPQVVDEMLAWDEAQFLAQLQQRFGMRLGIFQRVGQRRAYPLVLTRLTEHVRPRLALIGNAAHTVHPVAGQGFNLGLRDVATLAQVVVDAHGSGRDVGELSLLQEYARWRRHDKFAVPAFTHSLIRIFSNNFTPTVMARNLGLLGVELLPPLKRSFTRRTSGLHGRLPRLARGLPLLIE